MNCTHAVGWALMGAMLAYLFGLNLTKPGIFGDHTQEPSRWLGLCIQWFALFGAAYALMTALRIANVIPGTHGAHVWRISIAVAGIPCAACFTRFVLGWLKSRGRTIVPMD